MIIEYKGQKYTVSESDGCTMYQTADGEMIGDSFIRSDGSIEVVPMLDGKPIMVNTEKPRESHESDNEFYGSIISAFLAARQHAL